MRSVLGYAVFLVGLVLAVQAFFPGTLTRSLGLSLTPPSPAVEKTEAPAPDVDARDTGRLASFSPGGQLSQPRDERRSRMDVLALLSSQFAGLMPRGATTAAPAPRDVALAPWRSAVIPTSDVATLPDAPGTAASPSDGAKRVALIREIQRELKRVGCYDGAIDGSWGGASKRAMVAFIDRVNASLPLNEPDSILLLLVKGQAPGTCGVACPLGQTLSRDHRCVPDAILAYADKRPRSRTLAAPTVRVAEAAGTTTAPQASTSLWREPLSASPGDRSPLPGRMSIGGPQVGEETMLPSATAPAISQPSPAAAVSSNQAVVAYGAASNGSSAGDAADAPPSLTDTAVEAPKPRATKARTSRSAERRERRGSGGDRSVQSLFLHPLGHL